MKVTISVKRRWDAQDRAKINFRLFRILLLVRFFFIWRIFIRKIKFERRLTLLAKD